MDRFVNAITLSDPLRVKNKKKKKEGGGERAVGIHLAKYDGNDDEVNRCQCRYLSWPTSHEEEWEQEEEEEEEKMQ